MEIVMRNDKCSVFSSRRLSGLGQQCAPAVLQPEAERPAQARRAGPGGLERLPWVKGDGPARRQLAAGPQGEVASRQRADGGADLCAAPCVYQAQGGQLVGVGESAQAVDRVPAL